MDQLEWELQKEQRLRRNKMTEEKKSKSKKSEKKQIVETKEENKKIVETPVNETSTETISEKKTKKEKIASKPIQKVKKEEVIVKGLNLPISTKTSCDVCRFIKGKKINKAISDLEQTVLGKKPIPMRGEIPHRKGKIMSGRFPKNASLHFIKILKSLNANANNHDVFNPIITEASASLASRPYGRFGSIRHKRTYVIIKAKSLDTFKKN